MQKKRNSEINARRAFFAKVTACLLLAMALLTMLPAPKAYADTEDGKKLVVTSADGDVAVTPDANVESNFTYAFTMPSKAVTFTVGDAD